MRAPLHPWLFAAYISSGRVFVAHTHWLQKLGLTCCTEDRWWRTTTTPPRMRAPLHRWLLAAYPSPERVFVAHTSWLQLLGLTCCTVGRLWRTTIELRTGRGAQQPPRLGCGNLRTAGCWRPTFHRDAYLLHTQMCCSCLGSLAALSHTKIGCSCLGSLAALRTGCGAQQPPCLR